MTLLPCPFCKADSAETVMRSESPQYHVECSDCGARTAPSDSPEEAAARWNRRASYTAHLPAVMAATEPVQLDRPLPMGDAVQPTKAPCRTCRYVTTRADRNACRMVFDPGVWHYRVYSGALVSDDGLPTDRTMRCPGWAPKEPT